MLHLDKMLELLKVRKAHGPNALFPRVADCLRGGFQDEENQMARAMTEGDVGPCMTVLLQKKIVDNLCALGQSDVSLAHCAAGPPPLPSELTDM